MVYYKTQDAAAAMPNTSPWPEFTTAVANQCANVCQLIRSKNRTPR